MVLAYLMFGSKLQVGPLHQSVAGGGHGGICKIQGDTSQPTSAVNLGGAS